MQQHIATQKGVQSQERVLNASNKMRTYLIQNLPDPHGPAPVPSWPISSSRPTGCSTAGIDLMGFKKGIKREIAACPSLKDERYFDDFKRSLFIVAKSHECNEVLDPTFTPDSEPEQQKLIEAKKVSCSVSLMLTFKLTWVKTIVRRHLDTTDAQSVWRAQ